MVSLIQTAVPVTPTATGGAPSASPTPRPATPTPRPAPSKDRIGFPANYQEDFKLMYIYDRLDNRQVRVICGNEVAASVKQGEPFPYGSILVMETWRAKLDADGKVVKDSNGRFIRENLSGIFVMRKEKGFGEAYQGLRTGEWEYVAYHPDESHLIPPQNTANCAACHLGSSEEKDWVFRTDVLFFDPDRYAAAPAPGENEVYLNSMSFGPRTLKVKVGTKVIWTNHDVSATVMLTMGP
jgi:hemoglobin